MNTPTQSPLNGTQRLVAWFLGNAQLVTLLLISIVVGGIFSLLSLRTEGFPSPAINIAVITTVYRGASPAEMERQVVKPIEQTVSGLSGVKEVTANAYNSFATVSISYEPDADFNAAISELRSKLQSTSLPEGSEQPNVVIPEFGGSETYLALVANDASVSSETLAAGGRELIRELETVEGIKSVTQMSGPEEVVNIAWDQKRLSENGLSVGAIQQALQANNLSIPAGNITVDGYRASVVTTGTITSIDQIRSLIIGINPQTQATVSVDDVAEVTLANNTPALTDRVGIVQQGTLVSAQGNLYNVAFAKSADALKTDARLQEVLKETSTSPAFETITVVEAFSSAKEIREQVDEVVSGAIGSPVGEGPLRNLGYLLGGIWLIVIVMLIFVNWRAAVISALSIPLSMLVTLAALKLQGVTLNTLTLFSMVLVLGLVVDPAIVVIEAIQREVDHGKKGRDAVMKAIATVGGGVFMATLTNFIVFVPFGIVSGTFGQIIKYIPITVIPAMVASYFIPLIFLTFLAQRFLRPSVKATTSEEDTSNIWPVAKWFIATNTAILTGRWYWQALIILVASVVPLAITGGLFVTGKIVPVQFSAPQDAPRINATVEFPESISTEQKQAAVQQLQVVVQADPAVAGYYPVDQSASSVTLQVSMMPRSERDASSKKVVERLSKILSGYNNGEKKIFYSTVQEDVGTPTDAYPVKVNIYGDDLEALRKAAVATGDLLRNKAQFPAVSRVEDGFTGDNNPQVEIELDRLLVQKAGLSAAQVAQSIAGIVGTVPVGAYERSVDDTTAQTDIYLVNAESPQSVSDIEDQVVGIGSAGPVRVKDIATVRLAQGFSGIGRLNGSRYVTVQAQVNDRARDAAYPQEQIAAFWTEQRLAEYGLRADALESKGSGDEFLKSFQDLFLALGAAILLTYIVLVVFFKSFTQPLIILFTIPLGFTGVFPALAVVGGEFGFLEILGLIVLVGIVENVAIFLLDQANRKRAEGMDYRQAIAEATGLRFRPIFLTKLVAIGGLLPLILFSPFWRSLAVVVAFGVLFSGIPSLFTTPILYSWLFATKAWFGRLIKKDASQVVQ